MTPTVKIAPSILSADFARLGEAITTAEAAGVDQIHVDVMDGHFVPNISVGPLVVHAIRPLTRLPLDVHLMIDNPDRYLQAFAEAGADILTVHVESNAHVYRTLQSIHHLGLRAGIAINPGTPIHAIDELVDQLDLVLIMSVNPGFGGQAFIPRSLAKIQQARAILDASNPTADLSVDGGIGPETVKQVVLAGANVLVAGSAIFEDKNGIKAAVTYLRKLAQGQA